METGWIRWLRERVPPHPNVPLGLGDDAAVVALPGGGQAVVTTDMLMDGIDFRLDEINPKQAGYKALAVNLSDIAAMAAQPVALFVSVALPRQGSRALAESLFDGMIPLVHQFDLALAGGDTNSWDGPLVVNITLLGTVGPHGLLTRSGALPGDRIVVTGRFGGSILGRHLDVHPRVTEALQLAGSYRLNAGIDVSDGLSRDLDHVVSESGCGAVVDLDRVPIHPDAIQWAVQSGGPSTPLDHALGDGEDFELILAVPQEDADRMLADQPLSIPLTDIGEFIAKPGLWHYTPDRSLKPLPRTGYEH
ncbi:MAG: thiamine-phosphate kinase [Pirellulales bacterium]|nr:thiamine-phosphate kinase [Pirellulales bacterium]